MGRQGGVTEKQLMALGAWEHAEPGVFTEDQIAALRYADAMTGTPVEVPDAVFAALRLRYDEAQIVELTSALAWENYRARFDHALGVEAEGYSVPPLPRASRDVGDPEKGAFCLLPQSKKPG